MSLFDYQEDDWVEHIDVSEHIFSYIFHKRFIEAERMIRDYDLDQNEILKIIDFIYKFNFHKDNKISYIVKHLEYYWFRYNIEQSINYNELEKLYLLFIEHGSGLINSLQKFNSGHYNYAYDIGKYYYINNNGSYKNFKIYYFYFTRYFNYILDEHKIEVIYYIVNMLKYLDSEWRQNIFTFFSQQSEINHKEIVKNEIELRLAECLFYGYGTQPDQDRALCIVDKLAKKGYQNAQKFYSKILSHLFLSHLSLKYN